MILPESSAAVLWTLVLCLLCWGLWPNTQKASGTRRFEMYCFDFAAGVLLTALALAFTLGMLGNNLSFEDNLLIAGRRQMALATAAGMVFMLAHMLLIAAVSISGLSVAFPICFGIALSIATLFSYLPAASSGGAPLYSAAALALGAAVAAAMAHISFVRSGHQDKNSQPWTKAVFLSLVSGFLMSLYLPVLNQSRQSDIGLGPYAAVACFSVGVFFSTFVYNLYFMNLPVGGRPLSMKSYIRGSIPQRLFGFVGGVLWCGGLTGYLLSISADPGLTPSGSFGAVLREGGPLLAGILGLLLWREFRGAKGKVRVLALAAQGLFAAAVLLLYLGLQDLG